MEGFFNDNYLWFANFWVEILSSIITFGGVALSVYIGLVMERNRVLRKEQSDRKEERKKYCHDLLVLFEEEINKDRSVHFVEDGTLINGGWHLYDSPSGYRKTVFSKEVIDSSKYNVFVHGTVPMISKFRIFTNYFNYNDIAVDFINEIYDCEAYLGDIYSGLYSLENINQQSPSQENLEKINELNEEVEKYEEILTKCNNGLDAVLKKSDTESINDLENLVLMSLADFIITIHKELYETNIDLKVYLKEIPVSRCIDEKKIDEYLNKN